MFDLRILTLGDFLDLNEEARQDFAEGFVSRKEFTHGDIFRHIRIYNGRATEEAQLAEQRWRFRLSPTQERDMDQLIKRRDLIKALDSLLDFRGFWSVLRLGSLDKLLSSRCDEVR
jgi:hypothetical protein